MSKHLEELKAEVNSLCQKIIDHPAEQGIGKLLVATGSLYQKLLIVKHVQEHNLIAKSELDEYKSKMKAVLELNQEEVQPVQSQAKAEEPALEASVDEPKKQEANISEIQAIDSPTSVSITAKLSRNKLSIGLNDRLAFVKVLFSGDSDAFNAFVDKLNAATLKEGLQYFQEELNKRSWNEEEEVYQRFLATFERAKS